ncbi:hypothetical protein RR46_00300 [Papilio xuthus]|uniref:Uncharacterized protein n=1 Tax=Papilio xuthus TaxID=66420 RepID=A0A0N1IHG5_PAPXU|nr:hypothetical protein RR46_00300 [Papilio xuthus]
MLSQLLQGVWQSVELCDQSVPDGGEIVDEIHVVFLSLMNYSANNNMAVTSKFALPVSSEDNMDVLGMIYRFFKKYIARSGPKRAPRGRGLLALLAFPQFALLPYSVSFQRNPLEIVTADADMTSRYIVLQVLRIGKNLAFQDKIKSYVTVVGLRASTVRPTTKAAVSPTA